MSWDAYNDTYHSLRRTEASGMPYAVHRCSLSSTRRPGPTTIRFVWAKIHPMLPYYTLSFPHLLKLEPSPSFSRNGTASRSLRIGPLAERDHAKVHARRVSDIQVPHQLRHVLTSDICASVQLIHGTEPPLPFALTAKKSVHGPLSIGPTRRPSSSMSRMPSGEAGVPSSREGGLGARTKQVKWRSVARSAGTAVWPPEAASAWMLAKSGVVSRILARSSGVLSEVSYGQGCAFRML